MAGASYLILRSLAQRRLPAEAASLRPCTSTAAPRCTMLQRDVTVDVPGGDPRVTIINRCQIITTYHDLAVGLAFFLVPKKFGYDCSSQSRRRLPAEAASLRPCTSTAAPRCTMLQRDVTVDVPGGDPRVTIINHCQIITTYHDLAVGLAFFLVPKKFGYDCSSQSRRRLPAEAASLRPCTSTAAPRCTMLQRDVTVDVPGGNPRVTIINRCQIITTYHDISRPGCGPRFLLGSKKVWI